LDGVEKDIDILFVGDLYHSPRRKQYISEVIAAFPEKKIKVAGIYKPWYKDPLKALLRERRDVYLNRNLPPQKVNALYNRARVVLNIHNEQQSDGANPKVFEICAAGAYQICDANPYIKTLFPSGEIGVYSDVEQLKSLIADALAGDKTAEASAACSLVRERHTFRCRLQTVLSDLSQLKQIDN